MIDNTDILDNLIDMGVAPEQKPKTIKVVGVGNGGCNAVDNLSSEGIEDVSCLVCDSNASALGSHYRVPHRLLLGDGRGFGGKVERGREIAEGQAEEISKALDDGAKIIIIATSMGGGTGTAASPIFAREAKKLGLLTLAIATLPPSREKLPRALQALDGLDRLAKEVDALLVISNDRVEEVYGEESVDVGFKAADNVLCDAVRSIAGIIGMIGLINMDLSDVQTALEHSGVAVISTGRSCGENRVENAIKAAVTSPLLNNNDIYKSTHLLMRVSYDPSGARPMQMKEFRQIDAFSAKFGTNTWVKTGIDTEEGLGDDIRVTILAAGFGLYDNNATEATSAKDPIDDRVRRFFPNLAYSVPQLEPEDIEEEDAGEEATEPEEEPSGTSKGKSLWEKFSDFVAYMLKPEA
ncbi:MAG: cell division FtsZ family protein [Alloprevotella sp.]|nr:cell division FtsZ family protein [Alloprevotella sp.]